MGLPAVGGWLLAESRHGRADSQILQPPCRWLTTCHARVTCESGPGSLSRAGSSRRPPSVTMVTTCQGLVEPQGRSHVSISHSTTLQQAEAEGEGRVGRAGRQGRQGRQGVR